MKGSRGGWVLLLFAASATKRHLKDTSGEGTIFSFSLYINMLGALKEAGHFSLQALRADVSSRRGELLP